LSEVDHNCLRALKSLLIASVLLIRHIRCSY
jgi:hypothetical protein